MLKVLNKKCCETQSVGFFITHEGGKELARVRWQGWVGIVKKNHKVLQNCLTQATFFSLSHRFVLTTKWRRVTHAAEWVATSLCCAE
jgi:hypothetical protein